MSEQQHDQQQETPNVVTARFGVEINFDNGTGDLTVGIVAPVQMFNRDEAERISRFIGKVVLAAAERRHVEREQQVAA